MPINILDGFNGVVTFEVLGVINLSKVGVIFARVACDEAKCSITEQYREKDIESSDFHDT